MGLRYIICIFFGQEAAVGVGIAGTPVHLVVGERMTACNLSRICGSASVEVFGGTFRLRLCRHTLTIGVAAVSELIEDILELVFVPSTRAEKRQVKHHSQPYVMVVLVIRRQSEWILTVVIHVVSAIEVIYHPTVGAVLIGIIHRGRHSQLIAG